MKKSMLIAIGALLAVSWIGPSSAVPPDTCLEKATNDNRTTDEADFLTGGEGDDVVAAGTGADQYFASTGDDTICGDAGNDVLVGENGSDTIDGGTNDDVVQGMSGPDIVKGGNGQDTVNGGPGNDTLRAGAGDEEADHLYDGTGEDVIWGAAEDFWHKCADGEPDDSEHFGGIVVSDPDC